MSLCTITDAFLAARTADGDEAAFAELARRYRPLMVSAAVGAPPGLDREDLRQEALLALLATCVVYDRSKGPFAGLACRNVRRSVNKARHAARVQASRALGRAARRRGAGATGGREHAGAGGQRSSTCRGAT